MHVQIRLTIVPQSVHPDYPPRARVYMLLDVCNNYGPMGRAVFRWQRTLAKNPLGVAPDMYTPKCAPQRAPRSGAASQARFASARALGAGNSQVPPSGAPIIWHKIKTKQNPLWLASATAGFSFLCSLLWCESFYSTLCKFLGKLMSSFLLFDSLFFSQDGQGWSKLSRWSTHAAWRGDAKWRRCT